MLNLTLKLIHFRTVNPHRETLPGGYYGNNDNYNNNNQNQNPAAENAGNEASEGNEGADQGTGEGAGGDAGNQDYDGNSEGAEGGEDPNAGSADDSQQNPAEDPDIQQLQNFGGPVNDNFPEGLFPPGLLSKEDINEIRKQQERQQKEAEERERAQQQAQNPQAGQGGADYEDTGDGTGATGDGTEEVPTDGTGQEGVEEGNDAANQVDTGAENGADVQGEQGQFDGGQAPINNGAAQIVPNQGYTNAGYTNPGYTTPTAPAYKNAYQPIQPQRVPLQPSIDYANDYHTNQIPNSGMNANPLKNQFNYQPGGKLCVFVNFDLK